MTTMTHRTDQSEASRASSAYLGNSYSGRALTRYNIGDVTLDVVDSIKERCLQWIGRERKLTLILILTLNTNPKH